MKKEIDHPFWIPIDSILEKRLIIVLAAMLKYYLDTCPAQEGLEGDHKDIELVFVDAELESKTEELELHVA